VEAVPLDHEMDRLVLADFQLMEDGARDAEVAGLGVGDAASLHAGKVDAARRISEQIDSGFGGVTEHYIESPCAGIAALED
jgi:hypothetical protein